MTNCNQLKMKAQDGKKRMIDVANTEQLLRIIDIRQLKTEMEYEIAEIHPYKMTV